jgi:hypothetical protein
MDMIVLEWVEKTNIIGKLPKSVKKRKINSPKG